MQLKYITNLLDGVAYVPIYDTIGQSENGKGISGPLLCAELSWLDDNPDIKEVRVLINSPGGSFLDAVSIFSRIRNMKTKTDTYVEGVAASSAGIIAQAGHERHITDYGRLMVHPLNIDPAKMDEKAVNAMREMQDTLVTIISGNSKVSKEKAKQYIEAETWFNAKDALKNGLVDKIISTTRNFDKVSNELDHCTDPVEAFQIINNFINTKDMSTTLNDLKNKLGLDSTAPDVNAVEAVVNLQNKAKENEAKITDLTNKLAVANKAAATALVEGGISQGKLDATKKDELIADATNNCDLFAKMLKNIPTPAKDITNSIDSNDTTAALVGAKNKCVDGKYNGKTYRELEKENPNVLVDLQNNDVATHDALYKAYYGKEFSR